MTTLVTIDGVYDFSAADVFMIDNDAPLWNDEIADRFWKGTAFDWSPQYPGFPDAFPAARGSLEVNLFDTTRKVFNDISLPASVRLNDFDIRQLRINGSAPTRNLGPWTVSGDVTWLQSTIVPEPCGISLLALGGLLLARRRA